VFWITVAQPAAETRPTTIFFLMATNWAAITACAAASLPWAKRGRSLHLTPPPHYVIDRGQMQGARGGPGSEAAFGG
jgi:hypothetical protein